MRLARAIASLGAMACLGLGLLGACGSSSVPSPFGHDAGSDASDGAADATEDVDPTLGGPCLDDAQCDDGLACTFDKCDTKLARCRFTPDDSKCQDTVYCNGTEVCEPGLGCRAGVAVACDDNNTCTIDECVEASRSCSNVPRDADGDGDPDWSCGGGDCNDTDPTVSSKQPEICGNGKDDDCDGTIDEPDCVSPAYDTCATALDVAKSGNYTLSIAAAKSDYSASCATGSTPWRDVVVALQVTGPPQDIDVIATSPQGPLALAAFGQCGDASSEISCGKSSGWKGGAVARLRLRSVAAGAYPLYVMSGGIADVKLQVTYGAATTQPSNETCGTAAPITPGATEQVSIIDAAKDLTSACTPDRGELVYSFTLSQPKDVDVWGTSLDGYGQPVLELWNGPCDDPKQELTCNAASQAHVFERALAPGTYYLAVSATGPSDLTFTLELSPPTTEPADENCASGATLTPNQSLSVPLTGHVDDVSLGCLPGAVDAAYGLAIAETSDVLLVGRISDKDDAGLSLALPACAPSDLLACSSGSDTPLRVAAHQLAAGSYRAVIESTNGAPTILTAFTRKAVAPTLVAFADTCAAAVKIPASGGFFQGNTANANADYDAGCDLGNQSPGGAPDQMLRLDLAAKKRVILDMRGSSYDTLLAVRDAASCPGAEVAQACAAGYGANRSYLDLALDAGSYWVQVDGYAGASGAWFLDVFVVDP